MKHYKTKTPSQQFVVEHPVELLPFLIHKKVKKSRNAIKSILRNYQVTVNNKVVTLHNHPLRPNDTVQIYSSKQVKRETKLKKMQIVYEDQFIIVINKEVGLLSVSTNQYTNKDTAYRILNEHLSQQSNNGENNKAYVLHRLDREVSGLMIFAKFPKIQEIMQNRWEELIIKRTFTAIVEGHVTPLHGKVENWLTENPNNLKMKCSATNNGGLHSITHYRTIAQGTHVSVLELSMETARKNQLRVHMESIGHPILGDKKYGSKYNPIRRICLHADAIEFIHPITQAVISLSCPLPLRMEHLAKTCRKVE